MMTEIIGKTKPFYRFGEVYFLKKIAEEHWIPFIIERFASTGCTINAASAKRLTQLMECNPYYVQQLCHHLWAMTPPKGKVTRKMEDRAFEKILSANNILYEKEVENTTGQQIGLLRAMAHKEAKLTSRAVLTEYRIGSSAYVVRMKKKFEKRDIIDTMEGRIEFVDPVFRMWVLRRFSDL